MKDLFLEATISNWNEELFQYNKKKYMELTDLYIYNTDKNKIIGGCPREAWYKTISYVPSNLTYNQVENKEKNNNVIKYSMNKMKKILKKKNIEFTQLDKFELLDIEINLKNCLEYKIDDESNIIIYIKANTNKLFNDENNYIYFLPIIFSVLNNYNNAYIILKNTYTFEEKLISYHNDNNFLVVNNKRTDYDINNCFKELKVNLSYLAECLTRKKIPTLVNIRRCNNCIYKNLCKTM